MLKIYNSLTKKIEEFKPMHPPEVGMYTCGPTVYDFAHIGNFRTNITADLLLRSLIFFGYKPTYIMNITDVGALTGDNAGDADTGEDKMEKASKRESKTAWDIAKYYKDQFIKDFEALNLLKPLRFPKATDHIKEQIELIKTLQEKGYTYKTSDGIYFDTSKFKEYGKLSTIDTKGMQAGIRVDMRDKKNSTDFALWKFSPKGEKRQMEWDSPWGTGFPGWHIECSAMSMKYLGETFDIHVGGEDLRSTHHPNEIAQSEAATEKPFVHYWVHAAFMNIDGKRMSKSLGNNYTVSDLSKKGYSPMVLRYHFLTVHYRQTMNLTFKALDASKEAYRKLSEHVSRYKKEKERNELSYEKLEKIEKARDNFKYAIGNDLNLPKALSVAWEVVKSSIPSTDKYDLLSSFNEVFGLIFEKQQHIMIPEEIKQLVQKRQVLKKESDFKEADKVREQIEQKGYSVIDMRDGYEVCKI